MALQSWINYFPGVVKNELFDTLDEIFFFLVNNFDKEILEITEEIISKMDVSDEVEEAIFQQLVWWGTFCAPIGPEGTTIYQRYLKKNEHKWENKSKAMKEGLASWLYLNPGFYYVDELESDSGRMFFLNDLFEGKIKLLRVHNEFYRQPKRGDFLTGLLLPTGNGTYITQGGLFHFPEHLTKKVVRDIISYFGQRAISSDYEFNPQLYPSMITLALKVVKENI